MKKHSAWIRPALALLACAAAVSAQRTSPKGTPPPTPTPSGGIIANIPPVQPPLLASPGSLIAVKYPRAETKVHQKGKKTELTVRWDKATVGQTNGVVIELWRNGAMVQSFLPPGWGLPNDGEERVAWFVRHPAANDYVIKVRTLDEKHFGMSAPFTILDEQGTEKLAYEPVYDQTFVSSIPNASPNPSTGWNPCFQFASTNQKQVHVGQKYWNVEFAEDNYIGGWCRWQGLVKFGVKPGSLPASKVQKALLHFKVLDSPSNVDATAINWKLVVVQPNGFLDGKEIATNPTSPVDVTAIMKAWLTNQPDNGFSFMPQPLLKAKEGQFWRLVLGQFKLEVEYSAD